MPTILCTPHYYANTGVADMPATNSTYSAIMLPETVPQDKVLLTYTNFLWHQNVVHLDQLQKDNTQQQKFSPAP